MRKLFVLWAVLGLIVTAVGVVKAEAAKIRLGVTVGPHEEIAEVAQKIAGERGLEVELVTFTDFIQPNAALSEKDIDANAFQHLPYLQNTVKDRGYKIVPIANTVLVPMTAYSKRIKSLSELKDGATVTIPNDPSNGGRALLLVADQGLIELDPASGILPSVTDITKNDHKLKFIELDAAQIARALDDTDIAVINTHYAIEAGLVLADALFVESKNSPYLCIIAVREEEKDRPEFRTLIESYQNDEVRRFIDERFRGAIIAIW
jgi:D-methionine transport system substrate-binding protein